MILTSKVFYFIFICQLVEGFQLISGDIFTPASMGTLPLAAVIGAMGLGFSLSLLFFMDQSISGAMVNSPENR